MFFALSTGRSGSQTLAYVLTQSPGCLCLHEPHPQLVKESVRYREGRLGTDEAVALLRRSRPHPAAAETYGESNNRLSLMVPALVTAFPEAKFVWLQRDGRDFVASELQRGAYAPQSALPWRVSKWAVGVRADRVGAATPDQWRAWSRLEKLAWQWDWTHRLVGDDLERLAPDRFRVLQLERLDEELPRVAEWLGLRPVDFLVPRANSRRELEELSSVDLSPRHPNLVQQVEGWASWSATERAAFEARAGEPMDWMYPAWRVGAGNWQMIKRPVLSPQHPTENAVLRAQLARMTVEHLETRTELDDLLHSPLQLSARVVDAWSRSPSRRRRYEANLR